MTDFLVSGLCCTSLCKILATEIIPFQGVWMLIVSLSSELPGQRYNVFQRDFLWLYHFENALLLAQRGGGGGGMLT